MFFSLLPGQYTTQFATLWLLWDVIFNSLSSYIYFVNLFYHPLLSPHLPASPASPASGIAGIAGIAGFSGIAGIAGISGISGFSGTKIYF